MTDKKIYAAIIERIFESRFTPGMSELEFHRQDIVMAANELNISLPKNIGDLIYSFRYRTALPSSIQSQTTEGTIWIIRPAGRSRYRFVLIADRPIVPNENMVATKIPDATPGIVAKYAFNDEQRVLNNPGLCSSVPQLGVFCVTAGSEPALKRPESLLLAVY